MAAARPALARALLQQCVSARLQVKPPERGSEAEWVEVPSTAGRPPRRIARSSPAGRGAAALGRSGPGGGKTLLRASRGGDRERGEGVPRWVAVRPLLKRVLGE